MKTNTCEEDGTMRYKFRRLGDGRQAILGETKRAVTPFGGLAVRVEFWRELGGAGGGAGAAALFVSLAQRDRCGRDPCFVLAVGKRRGTAFLARQSAARRRGPAPHFGLEAPAGRRCHAGLVRSLRLEEVDAFFPSLTTWLLVRLPAREATLDLDSTVFDRCGRQEGAKKGYNPRKPGRLSHHPLLAPATRIGSS